MKKYLVFQADKWHTKTSKELLALATSKVKAINLIKNYAKIHYKMKISEDDIYLLETINQTQNFEGEGEFIIEEVEQNILL